MDEPQLSSICQQLKLMMIPIALLLTPLKYVKFSWYLSAMHHIHWRIRFHVCPSRKWKWGVGKSSVTQELVCRQRSMDI